MPPATITSDTALVETEKDNSYSSLLDLENDGHDIPSYVGYQCEVRWSNDSVKFVGEIISCDVRNGFVTVMTEEGNQEGDFRETFINV